MVSETQKRLIRESWALLNKGDINQVGHNLFVKLLFDNPTFGSMFYFVKDTTWDGLKSNSDLAKHGKGVVKTLETAVQSLDKPGALVKTLTALGARHHPRGVKADMFEPVGEAMLWAMKDAAGEAWTEEINGAWVAVYGIVTYVMTCGMNERAEKEEASKSEGASVSNSEEANASV